MNIDANQFATTWIQSWNTHNLDDILSHYAEDIEITTPMIAVTLGTNDGMLKGKEAIRAYWAKALEKFPDLHFELLETTAGVNSVALYYKSIMGKKAIEVMFFNEAGKVSRMFAYYTQ